MDDRQERRRMFHLDQNPEDPDLSLVKSDSGEGMFQSSRRWRICEILYENVNVSVL